MHLETKKIVEYKKHDFMALDHFLLAYSRFLGINPAPEKDVRLMIISFLTENFSDFSKDEIEKALNMAMAYKLDLSEDQLNTYNKLTPLWISTILQKYRMHRNKMLQALEDKTSAKIREQESEISEEEQKKIMQKSLWDMFNKWKNNEEWMDLGASGWKFLQRTRSLWTEQQIMDAVEKAIPLVQAELNGKKMTTQDPIMLLDITREIQQFEMSLDNDKDTGLVYFKARRILLEEYFKTIAALEKAAELIKKEHGN